MTEKDSLDVSPSLTDRTERMSSREREKYLDSLVGKPEDGAEIGEDFVRDDALAQFMAEKESSYHKDASMYRLQGDFRSAESLIQDGQDKAEEIRREADEQARIDATVEIHNIEIEFQKAIREHKLGKTLLMPLGSLPRQLMGQLFGKQLDSIERGNWLNQWYEKRFLSLINKTKQADRDETKDIVGPLEFWLFEQSTGYILASKASEEANYKGRLLPELSVSRINRELGTRKRPVFEAVTKLWDRHSYCWVEDEVRGYETELSSEGVAGLVVTNHLTETGPLIKGSNELKGEKIIFLPEDIIEKMKT